MKNLKKILAIVLSVTFIVTCFAGCSSSGEEQYSDETLILGYLDNVDPFISVDDDGVATGFMADIWTMIFEEIAGDYTTYVYEQVEDGYLLEEDGGFFNSDGSEYSADILIGAVSKNQGTYNEDYSFTEPLITDRVIAIVPNGSEISSYADFEGANVAILSDVANDAFCDNTAISSVVANSTLYDNIDDALTALDSGDADVLVTNEFNYMPSESDAYTVLNGELDTIEYVIATAQYSGWVDTINEAIREMKSEDYGDGDEFTPIVKQYFSYNASSFNYTTAGDN